MKRKTEHFTYELIRAKRRSMSLKVDLDGTITVRALTGRRCRQRTGLSRDTGTGSMCA